MGSYRRFVHAFAVVLATLVVGCQADLSQLESLKKDLGGVEQNGAAAASSATKATQAVNSANQAISAVNQVSSVVGTTSNISSTVSSSNQSAQSVAGGGGAQGVRGGVRGILARVHSEQARRAPRRTVIDPYSYTCKDQAGNAVWTFDSTSGSPTTPAPTVGTFTCSGGYGGGSYSAGPSGPGYSTSSNSYTVTISRNASGTLHVKVQGSLAASTATLTEVQEYDVDPTHEQCGSWSWEQPLDQKPPECDFLEDVSVTNCSFCWTDPSTNVQDCSDPMPLPPEESCANVSKAVVTCKGSYQCSAQWDYAGCASDSVRTCTAQSDGNLRCEDKQGWPCMPYDENYDGTTGASEGCDSKDWDMDGVNDRTCTSATQTVTQCTRTYTCNSQYGDTCQSSNFRTCTSGSSGITCTDTYDDPNRVCTTSTEDQYLCEFCYQDYQTKKEMCNTFPVPPEEAERQPSCTAKDKNADGKTDVYFCEQTDCWLDPWQPLGGWENVNETITDSKGTVVAKSTASLVKGKKLSVREFTLEELPKLVDGGVDPLAAADGFETVIETHEMNLKALPQELMNILLTSPSRRQIPGPGTQPPPPPGGTTQPPSTGTSTQPPPSGGSTGGQPGGGPGGGPGGPDDGIPPGMVKISGRCYQSQKGDDFLNSLHGCFEKGDMEDGRVGYHADVNGKGDKTFKQGDQTYKCEGDAFAGSFVEGFPGQEKSRGVFWNCNEWSQGDPNVFDDDKSTWTDVRSEKEDFPECKGQYCPKDYPIGEDHNSVFTGGWTASSTDCDPFSGKETVVRRFKSGATETFTTKHETDAQCRIKVRSFDASGKEVDLGAVNTDCSSGTCKASGELNLEEFNQGPMSFSMEGAGTGNSTVSFEIPGFFKGTLSTYPACEAVDKTNPKCDEEDEIGVTGDGQISITVAGVFSAELAIKLDANGWRKIDGKMTPPASGETTAFTMKRTEGGALMTMTVSQGGTDTLKGDLTVWDKPAEHGGTSAEGTLEVLSGDAKGTKLKVSVDEKERTVVKSEDGEVLYDSGSSGTASTTSSSSSTSSGSSTSTSGSSGSTGSSTTTGKTT